MKLTARNLVVTREKKVVLDDCSATIHAGQLTVILGVNGAGKSTFLQTLAGQLLCIRGGVYLNDVSLHDIPTMERARRIAWLPHEQGYPFHVRLRDVVLLGRYPWHAGLPTATDVNAVNEILHELELTDMADTWVHTLSAGYRHRLALARAMVGHPEVLLLDEPTANLDPAHAVAVMERLKAWAKAGHAVVLSCHDLPLASQFADRILLLKEGKIMNPEGGEVSTLSLDAVGDCLGIQVQWLHNTSGTPRLFYI